jgi:hypothetical protein
MLRRLLLAVGPGVISLIWGCTPSGHHLGSPPVVWYLRDGTKVRFYKQAENPQGKDVLKIMEVTRPRLPAKTYPFAVWHNGYSEIGLRANESQSVIWMVDLRDAVVGCSLDLISGNFTDERGDHPKSVGVTSGQIIPESLDPPPRPVKSP